VRQRPVSDILLRYTTKGEKVMAWVALYIVAAFFGLWVVAKWLGILINVAFLIFMAFMLIALIALGIVS
jgi:fatty acid desaturase